MNAKVQIHLSKQLIAYYNAVDMFEAYSLAAEITAQLQTLINQISKSAAQIKKYAQESRIHPDTFSELENLISISEYLSSSQASNFDFEREKYRRERDVSKEQYDANDLYDAYSLAHESTLWLQTMFHQIKDEAESIKQEFIAPKLGIGIFTNLERLIHIAGYLSDRHADSLNIEREKYEEELEDFKNA